jgi:hypothetical protein
MGADRREQSGALVVSFDLGVGDRLGDWAGPPQGVVASILDMLGERQLHASWCLPGRAFARSGGLLEAIAARPNQELAICLDARSLAGTPAFEAALGRAIADAEALGVRPRSLSFVDDIYDPSWPVRLAGFGIVAYRARRPGPIHARARTRIGAQIRGAWQRADDFSLLIPDGARPLGRPRAGVLAIPTSRTLQPYDPRTGKLEQLRIHRLQGELMYAAERGRIYQLSVRPEALDAHAHANLVILDVLLRTTVSLGSQIGFGSANLVELAARSGAG